MRLIIDINEDRYDKNYLLVRNGMGDDVHKAVANGTPIPDNATVCDIEQYAKEHNLFVCSTDVIEQMKKEILDYFVWDGQDVDSLPLYVRRVLNILEKNTKGVSE